jgi:tetratricopeptide (TPR) repeat protein
MKAAELIKGALPDDGTRMLTEAGLPTDWATVLKRFPPNLFTNLGEGDPGLRALTRLRDIWSQTGQLRPAIAATRALMRIHIERSERDHPDTLVELAALGALAQRGGRLNEAEEMLRKAYAQIRSRVTGRDLRLAVVAQNLGVFCVAKSDFENADRYLTQAYKVRKAHEGVTLALVAAQLAEVKIRRGQTDAALPLLREAWMGHLDDFGKDHPKTLARARTLARWLMAKRQYREAAPVLREVYNDTVKRGDTEQIAHVGFDLGVSLYNTWKKEEGLRLIEDALRWTRAAGDYQNPHLALPSRLTMFAQILIERNRLDQAEGLINEALECERILHGEASIEVALRYCALGYFNNQRAKSADAIGWLDVGVGILRGVTEPDDPRLLKAVVLQIELMSDKAKRAVDARDRHLGRELIARVKRLGEMLPPKHELLPGIAKLDGYRPGDDVKAKGGLWRPR